MSPQTRRKVAIIVAALFFASPLYSHAQQAATSPEEITALLTLARGGRMQFEEMGLRIRSARPACSDPRLEASYASVLRFAESTTAATRDPPLPATVTAQLRTHAALTLLDFGETARAIGCHALSVALADKVLRDYREEALVPAREWALALRRAAPPGY